MAVVLRVALILGIAIDAYVSALALFAQGLIEPLLDLPVRDPALTTIAGGEFAVVAGLYAAAFREPRRYRPLLWLCALDQLFAVVLPALAIVHGQIPATPKTVGPLPVQSALAIVYALGAARRDRKPAALVEARSDGA